MRKDAELRAVADRLAIVEVLTRYATAIDHRDWQLLDDFFSPDAEGRFEGAPLRGTGAIRAMIRSLIDGCGPTQHLLSNFRIELAGDTARSVCSVRAFHAGRGAKQGLCYELFGEYRDELVRRPEGWRVSMRAIQVHHETGTRAVLGPAPVAPADPAA